MIPLVFAAVFFGLITTASGQRRGQPGQQAGTVNSLSGIGHVPHTSRSFRVAQFSWTMGVSRATGLREHCTSRRDRRDTCSSVRWWQPGRGVWNGFARGW